MDKVGQAPRKSSTQDIAEVVGEAVVSLVPVAGGPLSVLWARAVAGAYEERRRAWEDEVVAAVNQLIDKVRDLGEEDLANNEQFLDALANCTTVAIGTSQREKLDALRNAILNAAVGSDLEADTQAIFINNIRDLTPSHLRLLSLLDHPKQWFAERGFDWPSVSTGAIMQVIVRGLPELAGQEDTCRQLYSDLRAVGLTTDADLRASITASGLEASRTSPRGGSFLRFIEDPRSLGDPDLPVRGTD